MRQMSIDDTELHEYAELLARNGFTIYEPKEDRPRYYFTYSRMVDGRECFGRVQHEQVGSGYRHFMPIQPSKEHGSSMVVEGVPDELTIEAATAIASPSNYNKWVGRHENYGDARDLAQLYRRMDQHGHAGMLIDRAAANGWTLTRKAAASACFTKGDRGIAANFAGHQWQTPDQSGMLVTLVYTFGDGRQFAIAIDDERRHRSEMSMVDIGLKWLDDHEPSTQAGTP
jgi:hypothetical protein